MQELSSRPNLLLELKSSLRPLPKSTPMCLLRTWSNGWFTSRRMHELKFFLAFLVVMQMTICATISNARYSGLLCTLALIATYPFVHRPHTTEHVFVIRTPAILPVCTLLTLPIILSGNCIRTSSTMQSLQKLLIRCTMRHWILWTCSRRTPNVALGWWL